MLLKDEVSIVIYDLINLNLNLLTSKILVIVDIELRIFFFRIFLQLFILRTLDI